MKMRSDTARVGRPGPTEPATKECGNTTKLTGEAPFGMYMAIDMKVNGSMTRLKARAYTLTLMELNTRVSGKMTCKMDGESRNGLTAVVLKVITNQAESTERAAISGRTGADTPATGSRTK